MIYAVALLTLIITFLLFRSTIPVSATAPAPRHMPVVNDSEASAITLPAPYQLIKARHGWMLANPNDIYLGRAIIQYGEYGELEAQFLAGLPSMRPGKVVEVGANIGTHSVALARSLAEQGRELIAFEPQPFLFQNLCANLALNGLHNVKAWPWACGATNGSVYCPKPDYFKENNFGGVSMDHGAIAGSIKIPCVRLDDVLEAETVSLLKVDVEGFELEVLQGAAGILKQSRPVLYVENDRPESSQNLIEWIMAQDYRLWWHAPALFNPNNFFKNSENYYADAVSYNMLCLPRELGAPFGDAGEILDSMEHPLTHT